MTVETYRYGDLGFAVDPESDMKERTVILLGLQKVKCNPRPVVIVLTGGKINEEYAGLEDLKTYCADNKLVYLCPDAEDCDGVMKTYTYITKNYLDLNVKKEEISIKGDADHMDLAQEVCDYLLDEYDLEVEVSEL